VLVVLRFAVGAMATDFLADARAALTVLANQPGYVSGQLSRAIDDPATWCLVMQWESVGTYRRALSASEVRVAATPLLARAGSEVSAFEPLMTVDPGGGVARMFTDLAGVAGQRESEGDHPGSDAAGR
jgi:heme oxygenase (mycobilin-producing)